MHSNTTKFISTVFLLLSLCACQLVASPAGPSTLISPTPQVTIQDDSAGREEIQTIEIDNCNGKGDTTRTEQRSQSIDVTVSAEVAAKLGASAEVISAEVQAAVGAAMTRNAQRSTLIQLTAPPRTRMLFQLVWTGKEQIGIVQNLHDSSMPIAFRGFTPTDVRIKSQSDIGCGPDVPRPVVTESRPTSTQPRIVSLKYSADETGGIQFAQGQSQLVAIYLQIVQSGGSLEKAIQSIMEQAANAHATVQEGNSINIQQLQAYLVWCPNADCAYPTNTSFPLKGFRQDYSKVTVIEVGESRFVQCPSNCWAVALR